MLDQPHLKSGWMVQCITGAHAYELPHGDPLILKCVEHSKKGYLDALIIHEDECAHCRDERAEEIRCEIRMCGDAGCPMQERDCRRGCIAAKDLRDHLYPPTGELKVIKSSFNDTSERIRAARALGWKVRRITKGPRGDKYLQHIEVRNPVNDERIVVSPL